MNRKIGKLAGAVPPHSTASKTVQTKNDVFIKEIPAGVGSDAATIFRGVKGADSTRTCNCRVGRARPSFADGEVCAREGAVAESIIQSENLVVSKTRIERDLGDDVRRRVEGISGGRGASDVVRGTGCAGRSVRVGGATGDCVIVTVGRARLAEQEVVGIAVRGKRSLWVFHGYGDCHLMVEVFGQANPILARKSEADVIPRIDGHGPGVVGFADVIAGSDAGFIFGQ